MAPPTIKANTVGSPTFDPDDFFARWARYDFQLSPAVTSDDLRTTLVAAFALPPDDAYVYHAVASVTLAQVQRAVNAGSANGLHDWYPGGEGGGEGNEGGESLGPPPPPSSGDITAYTSIFSSTTSTPKALTAFSANAKKQSLRAGIAAYLTRTRNLPSSSTFTIPKLKSPHVNPYLDVWAWSCQNLEWAGPDDVHTPRVRHSHPVLPILMHHFGCLCPSYEGLEIIKQLSQRRGSTSRGGDGGVLEIGSGNGYWTYLLRQLNVAVTALDNRQSVYRTLWISDTLITDGIAYLDKHHGARDRLLLLVYPIVGGDGFTAKVLDAYLGDTVVVAGTQNRNGYTAFADMTVAEYMAKHRQRLGYELTVQVPLPSFAGKDEALFVFERAGRR